MRTLYLRIWLTVVAALALFAGVSGWLVQRHLADERQRFDRQVSERMAGWGELIQNSLPEADAPLPVQAAALIEWSQRLRLPLALEDAQGQRIGASDSFLRREAAAGQIPHQAISIRLDDGRRLWMVRPNLERLRRETGSPAGPQELRGGRPHGGPDEGLEAGGPRGRGGPGGPPEGLPAGPPEGPPGPPPGGHDGGPRPTFLDDKGPPWIRGPFPQDWSGGIAMASLLALLFVAVAAGAWPVVRGLTRRLEQLRAGVETFGGGTLSHRVAVQGQDEVAALAASFNQAAGRIEALVQSHQSLLANASHELRSPLARLKMAVSMIEDAPEATRASLAREIHTNIGELDALVEEVLLSSRLEAGAPVALDDRVDLLGLAAEEGARVQATVQGDGVSVHGSERLLRRALRNLLENARRYGGADITLTLQADARGVTLRVCDRGAGVPAAQRERIFEPFYRLPGHAEREGGVGLGLALVRQIAQAHDGSVRCEAREGGGSCFVLSLPASRRA